mgnify:CR=1 FL=1
MNHLARIINEDEFDGLSLTQVEAGVQKIAGRLKKTNGIVAHGYEFDSSTFTPDAAKAWLKDKGIHFIEFSRAMGEDEIKAGARHSSKDMRIIEKAHTNAKEIIKHMKELSGVSMKADDDLSDWEEDLKASGKAQQ